MNKFLGIVKSALPLCLLIALDGELSKYKKLEYLYLVSNYLRQFGDVKKSGKYAEKLKKTIMDISDKKLLGFGEYLSKLSIETQYIERGDRLQSTLPKLKTISSFEN